MKQFFSGIKRLEADQFQSSSPKNSGKQPLTYSLYKDLCGSTLSRNDNGFSHLVLTTQWNLMCRSASVQTLQTQHFLDKDDSVGALFFKTKTNQDGSGPRDPRHLYANAFNPSTCWVTALGIYLACNPRMQPGPLFPGSDLKVRFGKALGRLLANDGADKIYGTHSLRKGVATFACGGSTGSPSIVSVCLRCGWSLTMNRGNLTPSSFLRIVFSPPAIPLSRIQPKLGQAFRICRQWRSRIWRSTFGLDSFLINQGSHALLVTLVLGSQFRADIR
jgi:hypothetical protein